MAAGSGRASRCSLRQRLAVGLAVPLGDRGFHHRQRLAGLHGATLEFAEDREQLLSSLVHQLRGGLVPDLPANRQLPNPSAAEAWQARARRRLASLRVRCDAAFVLISDT